jgi:hypothetical protein
MRRLWPIFSRPRKRDLKSETSPWDHRHSRIAAKAIVAGGRARCHDLLWRSGWLEWHSHGLPTRFNNVWFMFLVLKKTFLFSNNRWSPLPPRSFAFLTLVLYLVDPPRSKKPRRAPSLDPLHFSFRLFNPSITPGRSFAFRTPVLYPIDPPRLVLRISHSSFLTCRNPPPPHPVLHISHSGSLIRRAPSLGPSHFPFRFFNLSIPHAQSFTFPTPVL